MTNLPKSASPSQNPDEKCDCDCHAETKTWKECFWCANQHSYLQALAANKPDIAESASPSEPPFPDHECIACDRGEEKIFPPKSSIVGNDPVHSPSGFVCMKYMNPKVIAVLKEAHAKRQAK